MNQSFLHIQLIKHCSHWEMFIAIVLRILKVKTKFPLIKYMIIRNSQ